MTREISLLRKVEIPQPCPVKWREMRGDARRRRCARCDCHVHDLAMMGEAEGEQLLRESQQKGRTPCVQITRWRDGRIITKDSGWRGVVARFLTRRIAPFAATMPALMGGCLRLGGSVPTQAVPAPLTPQEPAATVSSEPSVSPSAGPTR